MARQVCLTRRSPGVVTRIECMLHQLAGGQGLWMLFCAAGLDGAQLVKLGAIATGDDTAIAHQRSGLGSNRLAQQFSATGRRL